jgi:hypothetical protein
MKPFPTQARRILEKLEIHYTPKHGSWLNMAEIELRVLHRQARKARLPDQQTFARKSRRGRRAATHPTQRSLGVL